MHNLEKSLSKPKILIVDDDMTIRLLMRDTLSDEKYNIEEVDNGQAALNQIKISQPDLVLLDVNMPGLNGFDVCQEIKRKYGSHEISIVMVTGLDDSTSTEKAFSLGATDFINKPINWDTFPYRIQYLIKARYAILDTKNKEIYLQYIEEISRVITQNKSHAEVINETLSTTLKIFNADRVFIIKPELAADILIIDYETLKPATKSIKNIPDISFDTLQHSEYPALTRYASVDDAPRHENLLKQQMINTLKLQDGQIWYLVVQQISHNKDWTSLDEETFFKICSRLTAVVSRFLLTEKLHRSEQLLKQAQKIGHLGNWNWHIETKVLSWSDEIYNIYEKKIGEFTPEHEKFYTINFEEDNQRSNLLNNILNRVC
ncbi:MAG: response regulator, partial [Gammaproteobacteria bacterium]|nr:response regulator [Gammaproteobacteria bacterium]